MNEASHQGSYRVARSYQAAYPDALTARRGEPLAVSQRESEWPGWVRCTAPSGKSGWVPESWVARLEAGTCTMKRDYSASELSVDEGEEVTVTILESGWAWVTSQSGRSGWVPFEHLVRA